jgi:glycosyltransferase involved in cell wall biosynthesis
MNSEKSLISVIIPTYNRECVIKNSIQSVLNQTYHNLEVIVVDDCSSDNTELLIKEIRDPRLKYYKLEKNKGACFARNFGFEKSRGNIIGLHDSDDVWHKDKIEKQMYLLEKGGFDFVFCGMNRILESGEKFYYPDSKNINEANFYLQELCENIMSTQTMLMKRIVFESVKFDESFKRYQDWDFAIRVSRVFKIGYLKEALVDSFVQKNSISATVSSYNALTKLFEKHKELIGEYREAVYSINVKLGDDIRKSNPRKAAVHFKEALKHHKSIKIFLKYSLSALRIRY